MTHARLLEKANIVILLVSEGKLATLLIASLRDRFIKYKRSECTFVQLCYLHRRYHS